MEDAVENIALFRRFALHLLRQCDKGARSQNKKLKLTKVGGVMIIGRKYSWDYKMYKVCSSLVVDSI